VREGKEGIWKGGISKQKSTKRIGKREEIREIVKKVQMTSENSTHWICPSVSFQQLLLWLKCPLPVYFAFLIHSYHHCHWLLSVT
jgi:hypothetical protein